MLFKITFMSGQRFGHHRLQITGHALDCMSMKMMFAMPTLTEGVAFLSRGGGCNNTGRIADVSYHEWGHGFHYYNLLSGRI